MARGDWDDDPDDEGEDWTSDDDEAETFACPACGAEVYEESQRCPSCGEYVVHDTRAWTGKPLWWILLGLAGIGAVIWGTLW